MQTRARPDTYGVPHALLEFQATLRPPPGDSPAELLKCFDEYSNAATAHEAMENRRHRGKIVLEV